MNEINCNSDDDMRKSNRRLLKRALVIDEGSCGKDHPEVSRDLNNLAAL